MDYDMVKQTTYMLHSLRGDVDWLWILGNENLWEIASLKWRTFTVEFNPKQRSVILPTLLVETMGSDLSRFAMLNDCAYNEIEVLVEKIYDRFCFSHGWAKLNGLYDLKYGAAVTLVNVQANRFVIQVKDRYGEEINYPKSNPPRSLRLNRNLFSSSIGPLFTAFTNLPYKHDPNNFKFSFSKWLSGDEIKEGFLMLYYDPILNSVMPINTKEFYLTDDTRHIWRCTIVFVNGREPYYRVEGEWKYLCTTNRLTARSFIKIGAPDVGANTSFYITFIY